MTHKKYLFLLCLYGIFKVYSARKTNLQISDDPRSAFLVEPFCFDDSGSLSLSVENFVQRQRDVALTQPVGVGFLIRKTDNPQTVYNPAAVTEIMNGCLLSNEMMLVGDQRFMMQSSNLNLSMSLHDQGPGLYIVIYANCADGTTASFDLQMTLTNKGGQMLSAGNIPLPTCFAIFAAAFGLALAVWVVVICRNRESAHRIHVLMAVLCGVKVRRAARPLPRRAPPCAARRAQPRARTRSLLARARASPPTTVAGDDAGRVAQLEAARARNVSGVGRARPYLRRARRGPGRLCRFSGFGARGVRVRGEGWGCAGGARTAASRLRDEAPSQAQPQPQAQAKLS